MSRVHPQGARFGSGIQIGFEKCGRRRIRMSQEGLKARRLEKQKNV